MCSVATCWKRQLCVPEDFYTWVTRVVWEWNMQIFQHDGTWEGYSNQQKQSCLEMSNGGIIHNNSKIQTNMNEMVLHTSLWPLVHAAVCDILKFYPRIFRQNSKWDWIFTVEFGDVELNHSLTSYLKSAQKTRHNKTQYKLPSEPRILDLRSLIVLAQFTVDKPCPPQKKRQP